jgi:eukaryotic-like serine/threonine-protein kinase
MCWMSTPSVQSVGRFQIKSEIGRGAFGHVYLAYDPVLDREIALKVPRIEARRRDLVRRFLREAQTAAKLHHPHIVTVFEADLAGDTLYIASEYVPGQTLAERCRADWPSPRQSVQWIHELAGALAYAHKHGIIHRDIKPSNILIDAAGRARITDFGLAKRLTADDPEWLRLAAIQAEQGGDASITREGIVLGTPSYMAPEQARGKSKHTGPHTDQYSLGVVFYELLSGKVPYEGQLTKVLAQVASARVKPPPIRRFNSRVPADLEAVALKAMRKNPLNRYRSLSALANDLQRWLHGLPVSVRYRPWFERLRRRVTGTIKVHRAIVAALLTAAAAIGLAAATHGKWWEWIPKE